MNQILFKEQLSQDVYRMRVRAPLIAEERKPGQFIILQLDTEFGERIPLTIADAAKFDTPNSSANCGIAGTTTP